MPGAMLLKNHISPCQLQKIQKEIVFKVSLPRMISPSGCGRAITSEEPAHPFPFLLGKPQHNGAQRLPSVIRTKILGIGKLSSFLGWKVVDTQLGCLGCQAWTMLNLQSIPPDDYARAKPPDWLHQDVALIAEKVISLQTQPPVCGLCSKHRYVFLVACFTVLSG